MLNYKEKFRLFGVQHGIWKRGFSFFDLHEEQLFPNINLQGKRLLEIGCGDGMSLLWAAMNGAELALGLEPYSDGSTRNEQMEHFFGAAIDEFNLGQARIIKKPIQKFENDNTLFDIVLMQASINHLDEDSCLQLGKNLASKAVYVDLMKSIKGRMKDMGIIIITDCSSKNIFPNLGLNHPFHPQIEWQKHQTPEIWVEILEEAGFAKPQISWLADYRWSYFGIYRIPYVASYFTRSEFRLQMDAVI